MSPTVLAALALAPLLVGPAQRHETEAERLHRHGVHCMDELERTDCAIENLEAVLAEREAKREIVTDAMLRLIRLYRAEGDLDGAKPLLRRFWDAGMKWTSRGHVPHSTRYVPGDFDVLVNVDVARIVAAPLTTSLGVDFRDAMFTCDPFRRHDLDDRRRWHRAQRKAAKDGRDVKVVVYEELEREQAAADRRAARQRPTPVVFESMCHVANALGQSEITGWKRITGAFSHRDFARSVAIAEISGLDADLTASTAAGRLVASGPGLWRAVALDYRGEPLYLARLDRDELVIGPRGVVTTMLAASRDRERQIDRALEQLVQRVPRDTAGFLVLTQAAMRELGFSSMRTSTRNFLEALLPKPKGMQVAVVLGSDVGLFTRVPTDNPVKGRMLVSLAQVILDRQAEKDDETEQLLAGLDIAEASDRRALLASYVMSEGQVRKFVLE